MCIKSTKALAFSAFHCRFQRFERFERGLAQIVWLNAFEDGNQISE